MEKAKGNLEAEEGELITKGDIIQLLPLNTSCLLSSTHSSRGVVFVAATEAGEIVEAGAKAPAITKTNNNTPSTMTLFNLLPHSILDNLFQPIPGIPGKTIHTNHKNSFPSTIPTQRGQRLWVQGPYQRGQRL